MIAHRAAPDRRHGARRLPLLRRLTARGEPVRCLVRDPRRLGPERVRVQITIGDLTDPRALRQALRGVRVGRPPRGVAPRPAPRARSRSSPASRPGGCCGRPSTPASSTSSSSPRSGPRRRTTAACTGPRRWPSRRSTRPRSAPRPSRRRSSTRPATAGSRGSSAWRGCRRCRWRGAGGRGRSRSGPTTSPTACWRRSSGRGATSAHGRYELAGPDVLTHARGRRAGPARRAPPPAAAAAPRARSCGRCCAATRR